MFLLNYRIAIYLGVHFFVDIVYIFRFTLHYVFHVIAELCSY